ncbi:MAG: hypothetical protein R3F29_04685 [Planctomycetota bacterium]
MFRVKSSTMLRGVIAVLVTSSAVSKFVTGYASGKIDLPRWAYYGAATIEVLVAFALMSSGTRLQRLAAAVAGGIFAAGLLLGLIAPEVRCGCMGSGSWESGVEKPLIAAVGGCLCVFVCFGNSANETLRR